MQRIVAILACALFASFAQAQVLTAISTVINVGQWIAAGQKKVFYIEVESRAETFDAARNEAFRLAIEQAVGTLILSETEAQNYRLRRNEIVTYASGYVDRYEITDRSRTGGQVQLKIKVWVAHSAIAGRLLHQQTEPHEVSGSTIAAQIQTFQHQQQSGDRLLATVLQDYPQRAFDVQLEPARVAVDSQRQGHLQVPFVVSWSRRYLDALAETLKNINQYPQCTSMLADCRGAHSRVELAVNVFAKDPGAWFNNDWAWRIMHENMVLSRPVYRIKLSTDTGQQLEYCFWAREIDNLEYRPHYFVTFGPGLVRVFGMHKQRIMLSLPINELSVQNITQVNVDIVRNLQCSQQ